MDNKDKAAHLASQSQAAQPTELTDERLASLFEEATTYPPTDEDFAGVRLFAKLIGREVLAGQSQATMQAVPELTVWEGAMPESNGKSNFTAILARKDAKGLEMFEGHTIARSEYPDRVRYEADCVRYLIGELAEKPWITDYDADKHSGYAAPVAKEAPAVPDHDQALKLAEQAGFHNSAGFIMPPRQNGHITSEVVKLVQLSAGATQEAEIGSVQAEKDEQQANVLPPVAAPAGQREAILGAVADLTDEEIAEICVRVRPTHFTGANGDVDYLRYDAAVVRAVGTELAARCRAEGGNTSEETGSDLAPTTSTVSAPGAANKGDAE